MPSEKHSELMPLKNEIESLLSQPLEKHANIAQDILLKAEKFCQYLPEQTVFSGYNVLAKNANLPISVKFTFQDDFQPPTYNI